MISENEWCYFYFHREIVGNKFLASFGPASLFSLFRGPQAWPQVMISYLVGPKLRPFYCCDLRLCVDRVGRYGVNGFHHLLSQLRNMHFKSKIIIVKIPLLRKISFYFRFCCYKRINYPRKFPCFDSLGFI